MIWFVFGIASALRKRVRLWKKNKIIQGLSSSRLWQVAPYKFNADKKDKIDNFFLLNLIQDLFSFQ